MKLLHSVVPTGGRDHIRVIVIDRQSVLHRSRRSLATLDQLEKLELPAPRFVMACESVSTTLDPHFLRRAMRVIGQGEVDVVFAASLDRISRSLETALGFLALCFEKDTRVVLFADRLDTAGLDWVSVLALFIQPPAADGPAGGEQ